MCSSFLTLLSPNFFRKYPYFIGFVSIFIRAFLVRWPLFFHLHSSSRLIIIIIITFVCFLPHFSALIALFILACWLLLLIQLTYLTVRDCECTKTIHRKRVLKAVSKIKKWVHFMSKWSVCWKKGKWLENNNHGHMGQFQMFFFVNFW